MKKLSFLGVFLVLLVTIVSADLTFNPTSAEFGNVNQGESSNATITITNADTSAVTGVTLSDATFSFTSEFIGTHSFDGGVTFDPNPFNLTGNESLPVIATINVPYDVHMGQYDATFLVTYDGTSTQDLPASVFVNQYTGQTGGLNILDTDSYDDISDQIRLGSSWEIELIVENDGSTDLNNVKLEAWIYDSDLKQIVAFDDSSDQTVDEGEEETFTVTLEIDDDLDENHNYDLYVKAFKTDDELNQHDVKVKDLEVLGEGDLCDVGYLKIEEFDLDDDEYAPGDTIQIDVEIENRDNDDIDDVIVEVWITESGDDRKLEKEKSSKTDINEDESETFSFELEIDDDWDDGDYEVHMQAYEDDNEENQCIEGVEDIDIERPDHKVIIEDILINPSTLSCGGSFTAEIDVKNVGDKDDDAVKVRIFNSELDMDVYSETFSLEQFDDSDDDATVFITAEIPEGVDNKEYVLTFTLYYDDLDEQKNYVERIVVGGCSFEDNEDDSDDEELFFDTEDDEDSTIFLPTGWSTSDFFGEGTAKTFFWIVGDIALVLIIVYFATLLFRKRK